MITNICPKSIDANFNLRRARENYWLDVERDLEQYNKDYCIDVELARKLMEHIQILLVNRQAPFDETENFYKNVQLCIDVIDVIEEVLMLNMKTDNRTKRQLTMGDMIEKLKKITVM